MTEPQTRLEPTEPGPTHQHLMPLIPESQLPRRRAGKNADSVPTAANAAVSIKAMPKAAPWMARRASSVSRNSPLPLLLHFQFQIGAQPSLEIRIPFPDLPPLHLNSPRRVISFATTCYKFIRFAVPS